MINWTYSTNKKNTARYTLGKIGPKMLFFIGINPSTAHPDKLDRTVTRVENFVKDNGYEGWVMLNVYPQRATDPNDMHEKKQTKLHREHLDALKELVRNHPTFDVCAAWGTEIHRRPYLIECLKDVAEVLGTDKSWLHLGDLTKHGHPRHPLYLAANSDLRSFDIEGYLND